MYTREYLTGQENFPESLFFYSAPAIILVQTLYIASDKIITHASEK
ncbi:hypothetical protein CAL7102_07488 [Dulcicalothrix desertica PCC 7102]|nr:hypothetical protein CAL7102_07488 [Dulcicalothrix desertica PCC 7102]